MLNSPASIHLSVTLAQWLTALKDKSTSTRKSVQPYSTIVWQVVKAVAYQKQRTEKYTHIKTLTNIFLNPHCRSLQTETL